MFFRSFSRIISAFSKLLRPLVNNRYFHLRISMFSSLLLRLTRCWPQMKVSRYSLLLHRKSSGKALKIKYSKIGTPSDAKLVSDFTLENFYMTEPIGVALGLNVDKEVRPWFQNYIEGVFSRTTPVSSKAIDETTGELVGVHLAIIDDPKQGKIPSMLDFVDAEEHPVKYQICIFLQEISEGISAAELLGIKSLSSEGDDSKELENAMLSVRKDYWGHGIGQALVKKSEDAAKKVKNCLAARVITTNEYSFNAYLKHNYQNVREFQFARYKNPDGVRIFQGKEAKLAGSNSSRVLIKDLMSA